MKQLAAPCPGPDVDKSQACLSLFSQNSVVGVHLTLMFKTSVWSGGAREGRRGQTAAERHGPSHLALISIAIYLCLTATPPPGSLIQFLRALAQIQRTRCPAHKHLGSYSISGPKLGHNEDKMSQAVSLEHPIPRGWQIRKQTSQSTVMGGSPGLWGPAASLGGGEWFGHMGKEGSAWVQVGSWETNGNRMPCLGNFCTVGSQPVDPREGGRHGKTGRDSIIQKVLSCLFRDRGLFPESSGEPKHLGRFPVENKQPTAQ